MSLANIVAVPSEPRVGDRVRVPKRASPSRLHGQVGVIDRATWCEPPPGRGTAGWVCWVNLPRDGSKWDGIRAVCFWDELEVIRS